jgi:predicted alpha/beta-fold hydrolase
MREANHFLRAVGEHFKREAQQLAENLEEMDQLKCEKSAPPAAKSIESDSTIQEFNGKCVAALYGFREHLKFIGKR